MNCSRYFIGFFVGLALVGCRKNKSPEVIEEITLIGSATLDAPGKLSEWGLFEAPLNALNPKTGVLPYDLNTPLFSDYALKARFVKVPDSSVVIYDAAEVMNFPVGTILVKNFYYREDLRTPQSNRRLIETRLLVHKEIGWDALTYVWNTEQTEALLEVAGKTVPVSWKDGQGVLQGVNYSVPNLLQCKSCHDQSGRITPIGPSARQLNRDFDYAEGTMNQLMMWQRTGMLQGLPVEGSWPGLPRWEDEASGSLEERARAWLEVNCAHCHRSTGPAKNTGLYLTYAETDPYKIGILKPPIAAGRGSGGLRYDVVPGKPDESILVYRIESLDPGVMMPELGRKLRHEEGIALIREWIVNMKFP